MSLTAVSSSPRKRVVDGVGASVGLEAGYTQFASGIASRIGNAFHLRRGDLRILVGCGGRGRHRRRFRRAARRRLLRFELIIGSYSPSSLAPVGLSALIGFLVAHALAPPNWGGRPRPDDYREP